MSFIKKEKNKSKEEIKKAQRCFSFDKKEERKGATEEAKRTKKEKGRTEEFKKAEKVKEVKEKGKHSRSLEGSSSSSSEEEFHREDNLEETLAKERVEIPLPEIMRSEYTLQLSKKPVLELHQELDDINKVVEERGYITREEEKQVEYVLGAVENKFEAEKVGAYSFTEEAARKASLTQQLGAHLREVYRHGSKLRDSYNAE